MIDTEGGSEFYGTMADLPDFNVMKTKNLVDVLKALDFIRQSKKYSLVILDPITVLWGVLQEAAAKADGSISFREWGIIKRQMYTLYNSMVNLPCHVIVTARQKDEYEGEGNSLKKIGQMPDCEKNLPYLFDVVMRSGVNPKTEDRAVIVEKDRSNTLPRVIDNPGPADFLDLMGVTGADVEYHQMSESEAAADLAPLFSDEPDGSEGTEEV